MVVIRWLAAESRAVFSATVAQTGRLFVFAKTWWRGRELAKTLEAARHALGQAVSRTGKGDAGVIDRIAELTKQIESPDAKKAALRPLKREWRELTLRLAAEALAQDVPPAGAEAEYQEVTRAKMAISEHQSRLESLRSLLPPPDRVAWRRVGFGYGAATVVMLAVVFLVWPGGHRDASRGRAGSSATSTVGDASPSTMTVLSEYQPKWRYPDGRYVASSTGTPSDMDGKVETRRETYPNGSPKSETEYVNGWPHGKQVTWQSNARIEQENRYGWPIRISVWDSNRVLREEKNFGINGERHGLWTFWHENGKTADERRWERDVEEGVASSWHPNGQKSSEVPMVHGQPHGIARFWREDGQLNRQADYVNGLLHGKVIEWDKHGNKSSEAPYVEGQLHGIWISWYENEQKSVERTWHRGMKQGSEITWYEDGKKKSEGMYDHDQQVGEWTFWNPDGRVIETKTLERKLKGETSLVLEGHVQGKGPLGSGVQSVAFSPDGKTLASGGDDGVVILWDAADGVKRRQLARPWEPGMVYAVAFSPDGKALITSKSPLIKSGPYHVVASRTPNYFELWHIETGRYLGRLWSGWGRMGAFDRFVFSPDGNYLASGGRFGIVLWDVITGEGSPMAVDEESQSVPRLPFPLPTHVSPLAFSPDGRNLAICCGGTTMLVDFASRRVVRSLAKQHEPPAFAAFIQGGKLLLTGHRDAARLWDANTGDLKKTIGGKGGVAQFSLSSDERTIAMACVREGLLHVGKVILVDVASAEELGARQDSNEDITCIALSPNGRKLAAGRIDNTVKIRDLASAVK